MIFKVGPWQYRVRLQKGLKDRSGNEAAGLCDWKLHTIFISADIPARRRLAVLIHELTHAWDNELGEPVGDEDRANRSASFHTDVWRQLDRQGGEAALLKLNIDGIVDHEADVETEVHPRAAQCPKCGGLLNMPIRTATPQFEPSLNRIAAERFADCEFCSHCVSWLESVNSHGVPTGTVFGKPRINAYSVAVG